MPGRVHHIFATNDEMNELLFYTETFVYPSLGEGFGLVILEAFSCNCPCIISDLKCFHEVAGIAAQYFNPNDPDDISSVVNNTISNEKLLNSMRVNGKLELKKFTWEKTAENT